MDIKMIVTDLDRTLLRRDSHISEYTAQILHACQQLGIMVAFATARGETTCKRFTDIIKPDAMITNAGAIAKVEGKIIYHVPMSAEIADQIILACVPEPSINFITAYTEDEGYLVNKPVDPNDAGWHDFPASVVDFSKGLGCAVHKIAIEVFDDTIAETIAAPFPSVSIMRFTGERIVRFADKAATKWEGIKAVAAYTGVDLKNIAAFGDDISDIEMLKNCGIGVAVDNAIPAAKAVADFICGSHDEDGVAQWLEERCITCS